MLQATYLAVWRALGGAGLPGTLGRRGAERDQRPDLLVLGLLRPRARQLQLVPVVGRLDAPPDGEDEVLVRGKGGKERRVPMHPRLRASFERLLSATEPGDVSKDTPLFRNDRGGRVTESSVRRRLYRYVKESRIRKEDLTPHDLRRTFATWYLAENPEGLRDLADLLGHSGLTQVMKYALSDEKRARAGVRKIGEHDGVG